MKSQEIYKKAENLVHLCGTRNPEQIAKELGIWIYYEDNFNELLGMYTFRWNHRLIFLNPRMGRATKKDWVFCS
ncbi:hypothetical protein P261_02593 [Lachnospiraceae bacterium TWA4]|nr:hypothetical protein P261_02593 [Lachnospiraceae bacterium TWA4]